MVYSPQSSAPGFSSSLEERAQRQLDTYWRIRTRKTIDRLERESRRMLQLEAELSAFADRYYQEVGQYVERLTALESMREPMPELAPTTLDDVYAQRDMGRARISEMKARYRALAKEIHPDRAMLVEDAPAIAMQTLNDAYAQGDLAAMLRLEAELLLARETVDASLDATLREAERAADTYAAGYSQMLHSPLNELMLRYLAARLAGWDWIQAVVQRVQRAIEQQERALIQTHINAIGDWRMRSEVA